MERAELEAVRIKLADAVTMLDALLAKLEPVTPAPVEQSMSAPVGLSWGNKVSATFRDRVRWIAEDLDIGPAAGQPEPSWLMACIAWESGRSFRSDVKNMAGSGATGLIQFMPSTAKALGTTVDALARMSAEDQLNVVWKYFKPYAGRLRSLADVYMTILWPKAVGQPDDYALFTAGIAYRQNAGLDTDKDGRVTKREAAAKVAGLLAEGFKPGNIA